MKLPVALVIAACLCWPLPHAFADSISIFDVAADFSHADNPTGVWSYGWSLNLGSPFILSTDARVREGLDTWRGNRVVDGNPAAYHNGTGSSILLGGSALYESGQFGLHPGPGGEYGIVRWTAPASGTVAIDSVFVGQDLFGTTTDAHILYNGSVAAFASLVEGFGDSSEVFSRIVMTVLLGDTIDFAVGFGRNRTYSNDSTGLEASITLDSPLTPIPEPGSIALMGSGLVGLYATLRRHRAAKV
jgi:hypothetical protein